MTCRRENGEEADISSYPSWFGVRDSLGQSLCKYAAGKDSSECLPKRKDPAVIDALIAALKDQESSVKSAAARSLSKITGQKYAEDASQWEQWRSKNQTTP
jgi:HEAT repeat protein